MTESQMFRCFRALATSCGLAFGLAMVSGCGPREELTAAKERWARQGLSSYDLELRRSCECSETEPLIVQVRGGAVTRLFRKATGVEVAQETVGGPLTVDQFFATMEKASREASRFSADFHSESGVPSQISIDWSANAVDDEVSYIVTLLPNQVQARALLGRAALANYQFRYQQTCFCRQQGPMLVSVVGGCSGPHCSDHFSGSVREGSVASIDIHNT